MEYNEFLKNFIPQLDNVRSFAGKLRLTKQYLNSVGSGSGRAVFDIDGQKVIKLAKNAKGIAQNETEANAGRYDDTNHIVAIVFDEAENGSWLISEEAKKVTENRIKEITGISSLIDLFQYLKNREEQNNNRKIIFNQDTDIVDKLNNNEFVDDLNNFIANYGQHVGDMGRPSTFGEVLRDGQPSIVLTDYGINDDVIKTYYQKKRMYELFNYADGNDDILSDTGDNGDIRRGMWAQMPYSVSDGSGVVNEDFINFVSKRDKYPDKDISSLPVLTDRFHECVNNLNEVLNVVENKKQFYSNLLSLQEYLIRRGFFMGEGLMTEEYEIDRTKIINEEYPRETADAVATEIANNLGLNTPKYIGAGSFGIAYDIGDNKVLKITGDKSEAVENLGLIGKPLKYIAQPYKVLEINSKTNPEFKKTYAIILEKLETDPSEFRRMFRRIEYVFSKLFNTDTEWGIQHYLDNENTTAFDNYFKKNPVDAKFFYGLVNIAKEVKQYGIKSAEYYSIGNIGYKKNGDLGFFDVGATNNDFQSQDVEQMSVNVSEDGSSLYSTDGDIGQDGFPSYNVNDTSPSINNSLDANVSMYEDIPPKHQPDTNEDLEYNHVVGDATDDKYMLSEEQRGGEYIVFHGSENKIDNFSDDFVGDKDATDQEGPGIYFTTDATDAARYGDFIHKVKLTPRKLVDESDHRNISQNKIIKLIKMSPTWRDDAQNWAENPQQGLYAAVDSVMKYSENEKDLFQQVWYDFFNNNPIEFVRGMVALGYDGQIINRDDGIKHIIVYNPNIIELIDDETLSEDRKKAWMPGSKSVTVKKKCQLGGNGDGTSTACNQGDINNLEFGSLDEEIDASEAYYDEDALQTIIDGKRDVGMIIFKGKDYLRYIAEVNDLAIMPIQQEHHNLDTSLVYRQTPEGKRKAVRLMEILKSHGGYFDDQSAEEAREIGRLLGYTDASVEDYASKYAIVNEYFSSLVPSIDEGDEQHQINFSKDELLNEFLNRLHKKSPLSLNPFARDEYIYGDKGSLTFSRFNKEDTNEIELQDIIAFEKAQGVGKSMMNDIIGVADEMNVIITLTAKPFGNDPKGLNIFNLINFYKKFGFITDLTTFGGEFKTDKEYLDYVTEYPDEGMDMIRQPHSTTQSLTEVDEPMKEIMTLQDLPFKDEVESLGGQIFAVGGAVRDEFLGKESKDLDIVIKGIPIEDLKNLLLKYGNASIEGESFAVILFRPNGSSENIDIAVPRTEKPTGGGGHKDFDVTGDHTLSIEKDLERRDFTINAIAKDVNGKLIDPFNGQQDLKDKIIRAVNPDTFNDDPLRMLRAVQFASRFGFTIEPKTMQMIIDNVSKIKEIASERILIELDKIVNKGDILTGAVLLDETGLFKVIFGNSPYYHFNNSNKPFDKVRTMAEFLLLLMDGAVQNPPEFYLSRFSAGDAKRDKIYKELQALEVAFNSDLVKNQITPVQARSVAHNMYKLAPQTLGSQILPEVIKTAAQELLQGKYPKSVDELAINGNDLMQNGFQGKGIGDMQKSILIKIYADKVKNDREGLLYLLNNGTELQENNSEVQQLNPQTWDVDGKNLTIDFFVREYDNWNNHGGTMAYNDASNESILTFLQDKFKEMVNNEKLKKHLYWALTDRNLLDEGETMKQISYSAVVLDNKSRAALIKVFQGMIPEGWDIIAHHMTIKMGGLEDGTIEREDLVNKTKIKLNVTSYAIDNLVMAVGVKGYSTMNSNPHITIAVNKADGGKPYLSNKLTEWKPLGFPLELTGKVKEI